MSEISVAQKAGSMITVMGIGGAGGNAVNHMWEMGIEGVDFIVCNTDQQALDISSVENKVRLGREGLGAGNDPEEGRRATIETLEEIRTRLEALTCRMLFITAGMGGGTGTGASPVVAKLAKEMNILTVAIVTSPLLVEGNIRYNQAIKGIEELRENVDSLLVLNNENILELYGRLPLKEAFCKADDILCSTAKGIAEIITVKSDFINVDFADVCKVMKKSGRAHMSVESASGDNRAFEVANKALNSPLLDHNHISGAKNLLLNFSVSTPNGLVLDEVNEVMRFIQERASTTDEFGDIKNANLIWGTSVKPHLGESLELVLVATGFSDEEESNNQKTITPTKPTSTLEPRAPKSSDLEPFKPAAATTAPPSLTAQPQRQVILGERNSRYADIDKLLSEPAYKTLKSKFINEPSSGKRVILKNQGTKAEGEERVSTSSLFDKEEQ